MGGDVVDCEVTTPPLVDVIVVGPLSKGVFVVPVGFVGLVDVGEVVGLVVVVVVVGLLVDAVVVVGIT